VYVTQVRLLWVLLIALSAGCTTAPTLDATLRLFTDGEATDTISVSCGVREVTIVRYLRPGDLSPLAEVGEPWLETVTDTADCVGYPDELPRMDIFAEAQRSGRPNIELRPAAQASVGDDDDDSASAASDLAEPVAVSVQAGEVLSMGRRAGTSFKMRVQEARSANDDLSPCDCDSIQFLDAEWSGEILDEVDRDW